jgi:hypothetical protein
MKKYPTVSELPAIDALPDLFAFFASDRRVETVSDWAERRAELSELLQYYLYGYKHDTPEAASRLRLLSEEEKDALTVEFDFGDFKFKSRPEAVIDITDGGVSASIKLDAFDVPDSAEAVPAVICIGALPAQQVATLKACGYAYISLNTASVYSDDGNNPHTGAYNELYPYSAGNYEFDSGTLMGWSWGLSRVIDALKNSPDLNVAWDKTAVTGCSRNGKAAVLAAAFDERVAVAAPSDPGGGGLSGFRYSTEGKLWSGAGEIYSRNESTQRAIANPDESAWFCSNAQSFTGVNYNKAPFDMHAVAALVAPRPLICWTGEALQAWLNSPSTVLNMKAAKEVYEFLGAGGNIAWVARDGAHANQDRDLPDLIAIMDITFGKRETLTRRSFDTLKKEDGSAIDGSGVIFPEETFNNIAEFSRSGYDLENSFIQWSRPGKYALWSGISCLLEGAELPSVYTDADNVRFIFSRDRLIAKTIGSGKDENSIEFHILSENEAFRHGLNLSGGSPDGMAIGFTSAIVSRPRLYLNGGEIRAGYYDDGSDGYLERYGVSLKAKAAMGIALGETLVFGADNITLEALPYFKLSICVELTKAEVPGFFGPPQIGFTSRFAETPSWSGTEKPNITAEISNACKGGITIKFDETMNPREFGAALDGVADWANEWASDGKSVMLSFLTPPTIGLVTLYLFRLVTVDSKMLSAPLKFFVEVTE